MKNKWTLIVGILIVLALLIIYVSVYFSVWSDSSNDYVGSTTPEAAKAYACQELVKKYNCTSSTASILIRNLDSNKNSKLDEGDTLLTLCQNYYGRNTDSECKKICGCA